MFTILSNSVITNFGYNKQIWPVPSMFVLTNFHCIKDEVQNKSKIIIIYNLFFLRFEYHFSVDRENSKTGMSEGK
jgi:hypothetical protein